jgi:hypothetical protein
VKVTRALAIELMEGNFCAEALRLVLGLAHLTLYGADRQVGGLEAYRDNRLLERTSTLRGTIGPARSNNARAFTKGVEELAKTHLFAEIRLMHRSRRIVWRWSDHGLALLGSPGTYGLMDIDAVRELERALPVQLYVALMQFWRMRRPRFALRVENIAEIMGHDAPAWHRVSRSVLDALVRICAGSKAVVLVRKREDGRLDGVDTVEFAVVHAATRWSAATIRKVECNVTGLVLVTAEGCTQLAAGAIAGDQLERLLGVQDRSGSTA